MDQHFALLALGLGCFGGVSAGEAPRLIEREPTAQRFGMPAQRVRIGDFNTDRVPQPFPVGLYAERDLGDTFDSEPIAMDAVPLSLFAYIAGAPGGQSLLSNGLFVPAGASVLSGQPIEAGVAEFDNGDGTRTILTATRIQPLSDGFLPLGVSFGGGVPATALGWLFGGIADVDAMPDPYDPQLSSAFPPSGEFTVVAADIFLFDNGVLIGSGSFSGLPLLNQTEIEHFVTVAGAAGSNIDEISVQYLVESANAPTQVDLVPADDCLDAAQTQLVVEIDASGLQALAVGGQFFLDYDQTQLDFVSADPGDGPFVREVFESVDEASGTIDYAVGVLDGGTGTAVPTTMARLTFDVLGEFCDVAGLVSFRPGAVPPSRITDAFGNDLGAGLIDLGPVTADASAPVVVPPSPISQNADAGGCDAFIVVPPLMASDNCGVASIVNDFTGTDDASGLYPQGSTVVTWTVTDLCGNETVVTQDVTVEPESDFSVVVELAAVDPGPFDRCITFAFTPAGGGVAVEVDRTLTFTGGIASATVEVPCGDFECVTARDALHTLRATDSDGFAISGTAYTADFLASPGDNDSLVGGNLNGDPFIDILDFGVFIAEFGTSPGADTPCGASQPHADISGDGIVDSADFTFIGINFLASSELGCDGNLLVASDDRPGVLEDTGPLASVTLHELESRGLGRLSGADLNGDGSLDQADIASFFSGVRPSHLADLNRDRVVDISDLVILAEAFRSHDAAADINRDGRSDLADIVFLVERIGSVLE